MWSNKLGKHWSKIRQISILQNFSESLTSKPIWHVEFSQLILLKNPMRNLAGSHTLSEEAGVVKGWWIESLQIELSS